MMDPVYSCELCRGSIAPGSAYVVRIDVFADPATPPLTSTQLDTTNFEQTFAELLGQIEQLSTEELQDSVHRRFEYRICPACHQEFLANPLGKPRHVRAGQN